MVVLLETPPPLPVTVTVCVPSDPPVETEIVSVLVNVGVPLEGLNENVKPLADVEADSETDGLLAAETVRE